MSIEITTEKQLEEILNEIENFRNKHHMYFSFEDDEVEINLDTYKDIIFTIGFPHSDDSIETDFLSFISIFNDAKEAKIIDNYKYISKNMMAIKIGTEEYEKFEYYMDSMNDFPMEFDIEGKYYSLDIFTESLEFWLAVTLSNDYSKYTPPVLYNEIFIVIESENIEDNSDIKLILESLFFELKSTLNLEFYISHRPEYDFDYHEEEEIKLNIVLRPLLLKKELTELLEIFNSVRDIDKEEIKILYYTKVIEYVSQSVVKKELIDSVINKLHTGRALHPNANYVMELKKIFDENNNNVKDKEAIKLTIITCCDAIELAENTPSYLSKLKKINETSSKSDRENALEEFASAVSDTRNMYAHAKTNYIKKGKECPEANLLEFSKCLKIAATQCIRWYARKSEVEVIG